MSYAQVFQAVLPEAVIAIAALLVLAGDLALWRNSPLPRRRAAGVGVAVAACLLAGFLLPGSSGPLTLPGGMLSVSPLAQMVKAAILVLSIFTLLLLLEEGFTDHVGEFVALVLFAAVAMMFLVGAEDLLMLFLSLEMTSLCLYVLAAFNKRNPKSAEAALKYFLFGGTSAAFMLFGLSLIYGITGQTSLREIAARLGATSPEPVFYVALVMTVIGLGFKVAAVPFHLWAPDAYQGAPLPAAAFIASGSKVASFFILAKLLMAGFGPAAGAAVPGHFVAGWVPLLGCLAALSMLLGNLAAIVQSSVRRLLAFSAVAQAGYVLVGLVAGGAQGMAAVLFYVITYGLTLVGAFGVVGLVERERGDDALTSFAGLGRRSPLMAFCLLIFVLSLAGIPPLAGFFGKFYLFVAAVDSDSGALGLLWLVAFAVAMSAVSLYYYLQILKQVYVAEGPSEPVPQRISLLNRAAVLLLAVAVLALGVAPETLLNQFLQHALRMN